MNIALDCGHVGILNLTRETLKPMVSVYIKGTKFFSRIREIGRQGAMTEVYFR